MPQLPNINEATDNALKVVDKWDKKPWAVTVVVAIASFFIGNWNGGSNSQNEIQRLTKSNEELTKSMKEITFSSLAKNGVIAYKNEKLSEKENEIEQAQSQNDTLKQTLIQVGNVLKQAEKPAVKILSK